MKISEIKPFTIRLDPELREALEESAFKNSRSLQQEVVYRLQRSVAQDSQMADLTEKIRELEVRMEKDFGYFRKMLDEKTGEIISTRPSTKSKDD